MTISTSRTYNPDITAVLRLSFGRCGLLNEHMELTEAQAKVGREELDTLIDDLQVKGIASRTRPFETITLAEGVRDYALDAATLTLEGDGAYIDPNEDEESASGETPVQVMTTQDWQAAAKDATGRPFRYYLDRTADIVTVRVWPVPSATEEGGKIRFIAHRLRADNLVGSNTMDLERYWRNFIVWSLAEVLAFRYSIPGSLRMELGRKAAASLAECRSAAAPDTATDFRLGHRTGWS